MMNQMKPPTVAEQIAQAYTQRMSGMPQPPTMQERAQMAFGEQMKQMQAQAQAQQALMAQAQQPRGIEGLQSGVKGFAEGGIVGYAEGGETQEERDREAMMRTIRRLAAAGADIATLPGRAAMGAFESGITRPLRAMGVPIPYLPESAYGGNRQSMTPYYDRMRDEVAPPQTPQAGRTAPGPTVEQLASISAPMRAEPPAVLPPRPAGGAGGAGGPAGGGVASLPRSQRYMDEAMAQLAGVSTTPATQEQGIADAVRNAAGMAEYLKSQGLDPNLAAARIKELQAQGERERALLAQREARAREQADKGGWQAFALGARGRSFGDTMAAGAQSSARFQGAMQGQQDLMQDLQLKSMALETEKVYTLRDMQQATAEGRVKDAMAARNKIIELENAKRKLVAEAGLKGAEIAGRREDAQLQAATARRGQDMQAQRAGGADKARLQALQGMQTTLVREIADLGKQFGPNVKAQRAAKEAELNAVRAELRELGGVEAAPTTAAPQGKVLNWSDIK